eukprot:m.254091 g.254091  ORF g.254091 m.254091 type:complete len:1086 (-) comp26725_c1_seq16:94-3351(-)
MPTWRFFTKEISVTSLVAETFTMQQVKPLGDFRISNGCSFNSSFVLPNSRAGTGASPETALFLRCQPQSTRGFTPGLFVSIQNPFSSYSNPKPSPHGDVIFEHFDFETFDLDATWQIHNASVSSPAFLQGTPKSPCNKARVANSTFGTGSISVDLMFPSKGVGACTDQNGGFIVNMAKGPADAAAGENAFHGFSVTMSACGQYVRMGRHDFSYSHIIDVPIPVSYNSWHTLQVSWNLTSSTPVIDVAVNGTRYISHPSTFPLFSETNGWGLFMHLQSVRYANFHLDPKSLSTAFTTSPFVHQRRGTGLVDGFAAVTAFYQPMLTFNQQESFISDKIVFGSYSLSKNWVPPQSMAHPMDWHNTAKSKPANDAFNTGERDAFIEAVEHFVLLSPSRHSSSLKVNVGWDENDYQIDLRNVTESAQYTRILKRNAEFGVDHVVFAPTNTDLCLKSEATDSWGWEEVLWADMGIGLRNGTWNNVSQIVVPQSSQTIFDTAKSLNVRLLAYVYPILGFAPSPDVPWLYPASKGYEADLGNREFQHWLLQSLNDFLERFDFGGFAFDYTAFRAPNSSIYAQWKGWDFIMKSLRLQHVNITMDNRQRAHQYGPWYTLAGSYDEPLASDENPETYPVLHPSIHTDHVAADYMRSVNYWYQTFLPLVRVPGFTFHQTERGMSPLGGPYLRDFDLLGYKYSLLSNIGTAGLNLVFTMIPARDESEFALFPEQDLHFVQKWLQFADDNIKFLNRTRQLLDGSDGTAAFLYPPSCVEANITPLTGVVGYLFLFNTGNVSTFTIPFDDSLSPFDNCLYQLDAKQREQYQQRLRSGSQKQYLLKELYPVDRALQIVSLDGLMEIELSSFSAKVLSVEVIDSSSITVIGVGFTAASVVNNGLYVKGVTAEAGTANNMTVLLPFPCSSLVEVNLNNQTLAKPSYLCSKFVTNAVVVPALTFAGQHFPHGKELKLSQTAANTWSGSLKVPSAVFDQIHTRAENYPIEWESRDSDASWLAPARLLLYLPTTNASLSVALRLNDDLVDIQLAYETRLPRSNRFNGFYWEIKMDAASVTLEFPDSSTFPGLYFENVEPILTSDIVF